MGGHTALNVVADDERVDGLILDATHSRLRVPLVNRIRLKGYPFGEIGHLAIWFGTWVRTGIDVYGDDPITAIDDLGDRPVLVIHGGRDDTIPIEDVEELVAEGREAGVDVRVEVCADAGHGRSNRDCPEAYREWVTRFVEEVAVTR